VRHDLGGVTNAEKLAEHTGVVKIKLRALAHPLVEVPVVGEKQEHDEARLQQGDPALRRIRARENGTGGGLSTNRRQPCWDCRFFIFHANTGRTGCPFLERELSRLDISGQGT